MMPKKTELPLGIIWDAVLDMDWDLVIKECEECSFNAEYIDGDWDETPLYLACQHNPPIEAIDALISAYPRAVLVPSRANKDLPLHIACRYQASSTALELMLREYPITAVYETKFGKKALSILWEFRSTGAEDTPQFWEKVVVILSAVALSRLDSLHKKYCYDSSTRRSEVGKQISSEAFLLHASVSLGSRCCPIEVLQYLLERDPNQASRRDSTHKLPLHIALGPTSWSEATRRKYKPRERPFIALLLDAYPHAAHEYLAINSNRYPLHLALTSRHFWSEGVSHLVRAAPEGQFFVE